jgi:hypothetical protein
VLKVIQEHKEGQQELKVPQVTQVLKVIQEHKEESQVLKEPQELKVM